MYKLNSEEVNCMGYALSVADWLRPSPDSEYLSRLDMSQENFPNFVEHLEENYSLKRIDASKVDSHKGRVIAFRLAEGEDFHFVVRKGRNWLHKRGSTPRIEQMKKKEVFGIAWHDSMGYVKYTGEIAFFVDAIE